MIESQHTELVEEALVVSIDGLNYHVTKTCDPGMVVIIAIMQSLLTADRKSVV